VPERPVVDLRSDTVTRPTAAMRRAMAEAEVGDDLLDGDPTVERLQAAFAERVGKEAALFVPSGTMGNQLALRVLAGHGATVVAGRSQHVVAFEDGAAQENTGIDWYLLDDADGTLHPEEVAAAPGAAVFVEDTHMAAGGRVWPLEQLRAVGGLVRPVHLDGARVFHAEVATGVPAADICAPATTVMACLSKGLGAPVGSMLAGPADVMAEARRERRRLGGQLRQAGVLAAAGLIALEEGPGRLGEDHARATALAEAAAKRWPGALQPGDVETNIVLVPHDDPDALVAHLAAHGVAARPFGPGHVRLVTHRDVDDEGIERAVQALLQAP